jgi:elongator complex protein 3
MSNKSISSREKAWFDSKQLTPEKISLARDALHRIKVGEGVFDAIRKHPLPDGGGFLGKSVLVEVYRRLVADGEWDPDPDLLSKIRLKPMRTLSGVTTVTVLTKPNPCPGECIFCPEDHRMPKSYLPEEPGAMRALYHKYDPYEQVVARMDTLHAVGHPIDKIELLILGGTWSSYARDYQEWFVKRCFEAMNRERTGNSESLQPPNMADRKPNESPREASYSVATTLTELQRLNEVSAHKNVGLVIETRPDMVNPQELAWLRYLGVTKVQMGVQSLDDHILQLNKRGHTVEDSIKGVSLLRAAGFKIVLHWMPNLLGATPDSDRRDFVRLWDHLAPDEIKIYPTQLLEGTELYRRWQNGEYQPYTTQELIDLIADIKQTIPRYCRVNRVIRDIPSTYIIDGNKRTSLRQDIHRRLGERGEKCCCVRCREVRGMVIDAGELVLNNLVYSVSDSEEHFISWDTQDDRLAGFIRLSLPGSNAPETGMEDLEDAAIIREVHVYGQSLKVGESKDGAAQHVGLGTQLLNEAERIAAYKGYRRIAVISAVGTRRYYLERGFERGKVYLVKRL